MNSIALSKPNYLLSKGYDVLLYFCFIRLHLTLYEFSKGVEKLVDLLGHLFVNSSQKNQGVQLEGPIIALVTLCDVLTDDLRCFVLLQRLELIIGNEGCLVRLILILLLSLLVLHVLLGILVVIHIIFYYLFLLFFICEFYKWEIIRSYLRSFWSQEMDSHLSKPIKLLRNCALINKGCLAWWISLHRASHSTIK